jgi:hypothetical protein
MVSISQLCEILRQRDHEDEFVNAAKDVLWYDTSNPLIGDRMAGQALVAILKMKESFPHGKFMGLLCAFVSDCFATWDERRYVCKNEVQEVLQGLMEEQADFRRCNEKWIASGKDFKHFLVHVEPSQHFVCSDKVTKLSIPTQLNHI